MPTFVSNYTIMRMRILKKYLLAFLVLGAVHQESIAQDDLFQTAKPKGKQGFIFGVNTQVDIPAADMAKRFGLGYRIGPSLHYKTSSNWLVGVKYDFLLGNKVVEDSLLTNVIDEEGLAYNINGELIAVKIQKRGFLAGAYVARVIDLGKGNADNGIVLQMGLGFMQHRLQFKAQDDEVSQITKPYNEGYDRLTNGLYLEPFIGYQYMDKKGLLNAYIGAGSTFGFTTGRRDFLYDVQRSGKDSRLDILYGVRAGLYILLFKKNAEDLFF